MIFCEQARGIERYPQLRYLSFECGAQRRLCITLKVDVQSTSSSEDEQMTPAKLDAHCEARIIRLLRCERFQTLVDRTTLTLSFHGRIVSSWPQPPSAVEKEYFHPPVAWAWD